MQRKAAHTILERNREGECVMDLGGNHYNGIPSGTPFTGLPLGFGRALAMNEPALAGYAGLTESQKEELIMRCRDVKTKEEMQKIVDSLVPHTDIQEVRAEGVLGDTKIS